MRASSRHDKGVCSAGFATTALPIIKAGATLRAAWLIGPFHGMITPTTPNGSWRVYET